MTRLYKKLIAWLRAVAKAYLKITRMIHPQQPAQPAKIEEQQQPLEPVIPDDQPPIPHRRQAHKASETSEKQNAPTLPESALPIQPASELADEIALENALAEMENSEPDIRNIAEIIRQNKLLARLKEELQAKKNDARAAERLARINENLARAARFQERMTSYIQANQDRAIQRKAEIESELIQNEEKIRALAEERARLINARSRQDIARREAIEKDILSISSANEKLIGEQSILAETFIQPAAKKAPAQAARLAKMDSEITQNIQHISKFDDVKREAREQARREAERHKQIIEEQRARARERAEQEAATMRRRMAEIAAQREANLRARRERSGDAQPPQQ